MKANQALAYFLDDWSNIVINYDTVHCFAWEGENPETKINLNYNFDPDPEAQIPC